MKMRPIDRSFGNSFGLTDTGHQYPRQQSNYADYDQQFHQGKSLISDSFNHTPTCQKYKAISTVICHL